METNKQTYPQFEIQANVTKKKVPKIHSLRRSDFDIGANEENAVGRKSDDIVESPLVYIYDLQNVTGTSTKQACILNDEQLLLLRGPQQPPRGGECTTGGDSIAAVECQVVDGFDDRSSFRGVFLCLEASILVRDECEEVALGGLGLGCEGRAGDFSGEIVVVVFGIVGNWIMGFKGSRKKEEEACGHGSG